MKTNIAAIVVFLAWTIARHPDQFPSWIVTFSNEILPLAIGGGFFLSADGKPNLPFLTKPKKEEE